MTGVFSKTNEALDNMAEWPKFRVLEKEKQKIFNSRLTFRIRLEDYR